MNLFFCRALGGHGADTRVKLWRQTQPKLRFSNAKTAPNLKSQTRYIFSSQPSAPWTEAVIVKTTQPSAPGLKSIGRNDSHRLAARNQNLRMRLSCALRAAGGFTSSGPATIPDPFKALFRIEGFRQKSNSSRTGGFAPERESLSWFPETSRSSGTSRPWTFQSGPNRGELFWGDLSAIVPSFALRSMALGPVCEASARGWTPLHVAAERGHLACLEALLRAGAAKARGFGAGSESSRFQPLPVQSGKTESRRELLHQ